MNRPIRLLAAAAALAFMAVPASAAAAAAAAPQSFGAPIEDPNLSKLRGGFVLPNGIDVAIAITTDTKVDGALVLRSQLVVDKGPAQLTVLARGQDGSGDLRAVDAASGATSSAGTIKLSTTGGVQRLTLSGNDYDVSHLLGQAVGSVVANSGNNRSFDVATTIDVTLGNTSPALIGSALPQVNNLASDVATRLVR